ncbi:MAG: EAL domain-containing protein [Clostridium sp.]|nr:EAL domain-containing protein [Clostridium sp.]
MMKQQGTFHASDRKRRILVADDEFINREMLKAVLEQDYEVIIAEDGEEALNIIRDRKNMLSLIILDLQMPKMHGLEVLRAYKSDPALALIPAIVMTADQTAEVECLRQGAIDFISKPYPLPEVILARVLRIIELSEDRDIIQSTERDELTGLYNREYFYRYAEQLDEMNSETAMDVMVVDINHFHMINERHGKDYGDEVLRRIAGRLAEMVEPQGGIVCRRESDTFLVYCPHRADYKEMLEYASEGAAGEDSLDKRIRLRMGVYSEADKSIDMERRFDRAKIAADTVRSSYANAVGYYDNSLHEKELFAEQLLEEFHRAIAEHQFQVYYQPKFDVRPEIPVLSSAEALVRWIHPKLGMISPGVFIPLFEKNGLIRELDHYVWREAAARIRDWKERLGYSVPVSVNVSRIDIYDPNLIDTFSGILEEFSITSAEFLLEITESAYTQDSEQMIAKVNHLRELGFRIEMDDFGTGYSSLNMISKLPIDALKLDMQFIRNAFSEQKNTRLLEVIIDIADYLGVPVIAEGVETEEQLKALREMGCDLVQGYYFSRPVPFEIYEDFVVQRKEQGDIGEEMYVRRGRDIAKEELRTLGPVAQALTAGFDRIYYVDMETGHYVQFSTWGKADDLQIEKSGEDFFGSMKDNLFCGVHPQDAVRVSLFVQKDALAAQLAGGQNFSLTYRILEGEEPVYYNLKAISGNFTDGHHVVIGICNVNEQVKEAIGQELGAVREQANRDALTGVKNRHAYLEAEKDINEAIHLGIAQPFAVVICDVNDLKVINDTLGHNAGDQYIRSACSIVCNVFKHSPVFRIGGDEFAVILRNSDYEKREELMAELRDKTAEGKSRGSVPVACGMAEYEDGRDTKTADVFERADQAMYAHKKEMKGKTEN